MRSRYGIIFNLERLVHTCNMTCIYADVWISTSSQHVRAPPIMEVLRYGSTNAAMQSKYVTEYRNESHHSNKINNFISGVWIPYYLTIFSGKGGVRIISEIVQKLEHSSHKHTTYILLVTITRPLYRLSKATRCSLIPVQTLQEGNPRSSSTVTVEV